MYVYQYKTLKKTSENNFDFVTKLVFGNSNSVGISSICKEYY